MYYSDSLYSLARPHCLTNKDEENVVIKNARTIFALLSLYTDCICAAAFRVFINAVAYTDCIRAATFSVFINAVAYI
jgi:hypothetical protein